MLAHGVLCKLSAAAIEWHDERYKGTRPIHRATGAPSNFSGMLNFAVASANAGAPVGGGVGECGIQLVDLQVDRT